MKKVFRIPALLLILIIAFMLIIILIPRQYNVPEYHPKAGVKYWLLSTGSEIGYSLIAAQGVKKPYPVIFLQGGPGGPIYDRNIDLLSPLAEDGFDVYLYDQVGCGSSVRLDKIEDYTVDRHRRDLEEIVKMIGARKVILIGQSWGAILATQYIAYNPDKVERTVFTGPGPLMPLNNDLQSLKAPDSLNLISPTYTNRQGKDKIYNIRASVVEFCARFFNWKLASDKEMDAFSTLLNHEMGKSTVCDTSYLSEVNNIESGSGYYSMIKTAQSFNKVPDIRQKLANSNIPVLLLRGQCDGIKWGYANEYLQLFKNHRLVIVYGAGHSIGIEQPKVYLQEIRQFLSE
ncbi:MAG: alpha/beta hydrolase [Lentimicrobium sp.]|nr:alpha/beta hydrolase [Lentimicrobium sp.]